MFTINEHYADVYGLTFHPMRPFVFFSSSRDTTIRCWQIDGFLAPLKMQMLFAPEQLRMHASPEDALKKGSEYLLCSPQSKKMIARVKVED